MAKIVVIEDQLVLATVYRNKLTAEGYQVEVASDGQAGLDLINSARPDLVILDLTLPKVNGIEVLKKVRANPLFQALPVIIYSNASLPRMVEEAWRAGATMVLSKSSHSPKEIVDSVRTALSAASEGQPGTAAATNPLPAPPDVLLSTPPRATTGHILLVEEHADIRALISFLLEQSGHKVTVVESWDEALPKAEMYKFDLYLFNGAGADGAGLTLCRQLRESYPLPIVMYSTAASPAEQQVALDAGASTYLTKPGDLLNIARLLSALIEESKRLVDSTGSPSPVVSPVAA